MSDNVDGLIQGIGRQVGDGLDAVIVANRKQRRAVPTKIRDPVDFGIAVDEAFELEQRFAVIGQEQRRSEFVEFLGPLQRPTAVVVLQYPLTAPVETGNREHTGQSSAEDLD